MEVDAIIGIASLVVQICGVCLDLYKKYAEQQNQLIPLSEAEFRNELNELRQRSQRLANPPTLPAGSNTIEIERLQKTLQELSLSTFAAVNDLSIALKELQPERGQSRIDSLLKARRSMFGNQKNNLNQLRDNIDSYKQRTNDLLLQLLNEKQNLSLELEKDIQDSQKEHIKLSRQNTDEIISVLDVELKNIRTLILQSRDGNTRVLETSREQVFPEAQEATEHFSITSFSTRSTGSGVESTVRDFQRIISRARLCLHFDGITERHNAIKEAHHATFNWIFRTDVPETKFEAFASFPDWLEHGRGIYWIQGKAGSGKSTLIKRVHEHESTQEYLRRWGGDSEVQTASFFFWYFGSSMQKTLEGMLRSLLYSLLEKAPQHVITALPELFVEATKLEDGTDLRPPPLYQLLQWFQQLVDTCERTQKFKVCFFIDGLDECSSDSKALVAFLNRLGESHDVVKFVLASRPLPIFIDAFSDLPGLRVQDLTASDIVDYTQLLICNGRKDRYVIGEEEATKLVKVISLRSQGVFLWVVVVVQSVLEGLRNGDTVGEIYDRVKELPEELTDLYRRMLEGIEKRYRPQAAEMLLLVATAFDPMHPKQADASITPFTAVHFSFATEGCTKAMEAPIQPYTDCELRDRVRLLDQRLRSRCLGLVELQFSPRLGLDVAMLATSGNDSLAMVVTPFHRTAIEFLLDPDVADYLRGQASQGFDPFNTLFCSCIWVVKIANSLFSYPPIQNPSECSLWDYLLFVHLITFDAQRRGYGIKQEFLDELDHVLQTQWECTEELYIPRQHPAIRWLPALLCSNEPVQDTGMFGLGREIKEVAVYMGDELCRQLEERYQRIGYIRILALMWRPDDLDTLLRSSPSVSLDDLTFLLQLLIHVRFSARNMEKAQLYFEENVLIALGALLEAGADPNAPDHEDPGLTIWTRFVQSIEGILTSKTALMVADRGGETLRGMVDMFITNGADPVATVPFHGDQAPPSVFLHTMHLIAAQGQTLFTAPGENLMGQRYTPLKDALLKAAQAARVSEEKAGVHSRTSRARGSLKWFSGSGRPAAASTGYKDNGNPDEDKLSPMRLLKKWTSRAKSVG